MHRRRDGVPDAGAHAVNAGGRAVATPRIEPRGGRRQPLAAVPEALPPELRSLYALRPGALWRTLRGQRPSFWFVSIYLLFEYVRPQQIYDALRGPPYTLIAIILAAIALILEHGKILVRGPELQLGLFSCVVLASSAAGFYPSISFAYENISLFFSWVLIYILIANVVVTEQRFLLFVAAFLLYSFKMSQHATISWAKDGFAFRNWGATGAPGWFENSGEFGIQMCVFLPIAVAFIVALGRYWKPWMRAMGWAVAGTAITGIIASSSRGALLGLAGVTLWMLTHTRRKLRALVVTIALAAAVYTITPDAQKARFQRAGQDVTSVSRTDNWRDGLQMMQQFPVLGIGYANWRTYHLNYYGSQLLPHNMFIEAGAEMGYSGLFAFLALIGCTFAVNRNTRKLTRSEGEPGHFMSVMSHGLDGALVGCLVSGFFVTVLYYPFFWINLAMTIALNRAAANQRAQGASADPVAIIAAPRRPLRGRESRA